MKLKSFSGNPNVFSVGVWLLYFLFAFVQTSMAEPDYRRYQVESGIIEYRIEGLQQGTEIVYFDQWGKREAKFTTLKKPRSGNQHTLTLIDGLIVYKIDLDKKIGIKEDNSILKEILDQNKEAALVNVGAELMKRLKGESVGFDDVSDRKCEVWTIKNLGSTSWMWEWIPLKMTIEMPQSQIIINAVRVEDNVIVPEEKFAVPDNIHFIQGNLEEILISFRKVDCFSMFCLTDS